MLVDVLIIVLRNLDLQQKDLIGVCSPAKCTFQQYETGKMENSKPSLEIIISFTEIRSVIIW